LGKIVTHQTQTYRIVTYCIKSISAPEKAEKCKEEV